MKSMTTKLMTGMTLGLGLCTMAAFQAPTAEAAPYHVRKQIRRGKNIKHSGKLQVLSGKMLIRKGNRLIQMGHNARRTGNTLLLQGKLKVRQGLRTLQRARFHRGYHHIMLKRRGHKLIRKGNRLKTLGYNKLRDSRKLLRKGKLNKKLGWTMIRRGNSKIRLGNRMIRNGRRMAYGPHRHRRHFAMR